MFENEVFHGDGQRIVFLSIKNIFNPSSYISEKKKK